ncbi:MAG: DsrE family protein [Pseudomonadota bacterium]|nr:MAG: hypothetical protein DIU72_09070 [Pseudomonadota bacterium]
MSRRTLLHLHGESFARRYQVASMAITAAASGDDVHVVLWFDGLARFVRGGFDFAREGDPGDEEVVRRHAALELPPPSAMLGEARALGARLYVCETAVLLAGLRPEEVRPVVDDILGLQQIHALAGEADVVLYV